MTALVRMRCLTFAAVIALGLSATTARAQGLIVKLPAEDGVGVRYEGTYKQLVKRPNSVPVSYTHLTLPTNREV